MGTCQPEGRKGGIWLLGKGPEGEEENGRRNEQAEFQERCNNRTEQGDVQRPRLRANPACTGSLQLQGTRQSQLDFALSPLSQRNLHSPSGPLARL